MNATCNSVESSTHGLVPSVVGKAEVINFCVGSWADWTSPFGRAGLIGWFLFLHGGG